MAGFRTAYVFDVAQTEDWDNSGVMTYANGNQANDRRHQIKLRGYYQVTPEWLLGGTAQILSGTPRTCLGYFGTEQSDPFGYAAAYHFCGPEVLYIAERPVPEPLVATGAATGLVRTVSERLPGTVGDGT